MNFSAVHSYVFVTFGEWQTILLSQTSLTFILLVTLFHAFLTRNIHVVGSKRTLTTQMVVMVGTGVRLFTLTPHIGEIKGGVEMGRKITLCLSSGLHLGLY
jgi:hypothetical protein